MQYEGDVYRPPSEARSLIIQVTIGCSHNKCTFCHMYTDKQFRVRKREEILADLDECRDTYGPYVQRVFFADGDALVVKTELLLELLHYVKKNFPYAERITSYGTAKDVLRKSEEELVALRKAGLALIYLGADDSGNDLVRFLKLLFRDTEKSAAEKKKILESEFDLDVSSDMEREMNTMCNLSEGIFERGIVQGIEQGIEQGESGMILSMLKKGYDLTSIADISQWSIKKIEQLAKAHHLL